MSVCAKCRSIDYQRLVLLSVVDPLVAEDDLFVVSSNLAMPLQMLGYCGAAVD